MIHSTQQKPATSEYNKQEGDHMCIGYNIWDRAQGNRKSDLFHKTQTNIISFTKLYKAQATEYNKQEGALLATTYALGNNISNRAQENPKNTFLPHKPVYNREQACHLWV